MYVSASVLTKLTQDTQALVMKVHSVFISVHVGNVYLTNKKRQLNRFFNLMPMFDDLSSSLVLLVVISVSPCVTMFPPPN